MAPTLMRLANRSHWHEVHRQCGIQMLGMVMQKKCIQAKYRCQGHCPNSEKHRVSPFYSGPQE